MKILSAQATVASRRRWTELVYLLELTLWRDKFGPTPVSRVFRFSDAPRTELGQEWLPLVISWGNLSDALNPADPDVTVGSLDLTLANNYPLAGRARFSDLIRHGLNNDATTYDLLYGDAVLRLLFRGGVAGDDVKLYRFLVEEARNLTGDALTLRMSGIELSLEDGDDLYRVSTADFPSADPDAVSQPVPIVLGSVKNLVPLPIVAGLVDALGADITATAPANGGTLPLSDADVVGRFPATGTVQVDDEKITYTGRSTSVTAPALTGITRGASATVKAAHALGSPVFQVLTQYVYAVAENRGLHRVQAITAVRSNGALVVPTSYTVELANTTLKPGRSFAVLKFAVKPKISNQVKLVVQDTIAVVDTIAVQDALGVSDNITFVQTGEISQGFQTNAGLPVVAQANGSGYTSLPFPALPSGGGVNYVQFQLQCWNGYSLALQLTLYMYGPGYSRTLQAPYNVPPGGAITFSWSQNGNAYGDHQVSCGNGGGIGGIQGFTAIVHRNPAALTKSGAAVRSGSVAKAGAATKTGTVVISGNSSADTVLGDLTADVQGLQDDAVGTLSGLPNRFLELPHDHTKLLLREVYKEVDPALYDAPSWTQARQAQVQEGYRWGWAFTGGSFNEWRRQVGYQGRAELYQEGGLWRYTWRDQSPVRARFDDRNLADDVVVDWSPRTEVVTDLTVAFDASKQGWQQTVILQSGLSLNRYGLRRGRRDLQGRAGRTLELPWVHDAATATRLGAYWLSQWETERLRPRLRAFWDAVSLDKTDCIEIISPLLSAYGPTRYAIRRKTYDLETGLVAFECEEADLPPLEMAVPGTYRLRDFNDAQIGAALNILRTFAPAILGATAVNVGRARSTLARYWVGGLTDHPLPATLRMLRQGVDVTPLQGVYRAAFPNRLRTLPAALAFRQMRSPSLAALYAMSGAVMNRVLAGTYRLPRTGTLTRAGGYTLNFPNRERTLSGSYVFSAGAVNIVRAAGYHLRLADVSPAWTARYVLRDVFTRTLTADYTVPPRITLSAAYVIVSTWDAAGAVWDSGLKWDP